MTLTRAQIDDLASLGLEYIGAVALGGVTVAGDPLVIGRNPANGAYWGGRTERGAWVLFVREDPEAEGEITEVVAVAASNVGRLWDLYDEAYIAAELLPGTSRVTLLDGVRKEDAALRQSMYEPDEDALPWLLDDGAVFACPARQGIVVRVNAEPAALISLAFGAATSAVPSAPISEE